MKRPDELFSLNGRVALVTGSTRGLGWTMAQALAAAGATVAVNGRDRDTVEARAKQLGGLACPGDVAVEPDAQRVVDSVLERCGRLDILVNNAGTVHRGSLTRTTSSDWARVVDLNLNASFLLARQALPAMRRQRHGRVISVGSVMSGIARPGAASYVTSKHALVGLTRAISVEFGAHGITANLIAPGFIATEFNAQVRSDESFTQHVIARTPCARWGEPNDLAGAIVVLASDSASYVNGQVLYVDGGLVGAF